MIAPLPNEDPQDFLERIVEALGEHFDCVQIFTQVCSIDATDVFSGGRGNILARQKQIENWLEAGGGQTIFEEENADDE
jgi:hypothetical protein